MAWCCLVAGGGLAELLRRERVPYHDKERLFLVLGLFLSGRVSAGKAAELLGLRVDEFWRLLRRLGVEYSVYDEEEIDAHQRVFGT